MPEPLELTDMQRLLIDGMSRWPESRYALLRVNKGSEADARKWLGSIVPQVALASHRAAEAEYQPDGTADVRLEPVFAIAFTAAGFAALGLTESEGFLAEFRQGMTSVARRVNLGDPDALQWGTEPDSIHMLFMMFSKKGRVEDDWKACQPGVWATVVRTFDCFVSASGREHFGFKDGISQPRIEGSDLPLQISAAEVAADTIKPGEFVLGYMNEAGVLPTSPTIPARLDPKNGLPAVPSRARANGDGRRDFGRNGSYLVLRQLNQDVDAFNTFLAESAPTPLERERLAAKLVGRWRTGAPLVKAPEVDRKSLANSNDFTYYETDRDGHACPLGAHIRRANPRDSLVDDDLGIGPDLAAQDVRRHRIIRRGRLYDEGKEKGLLFLCLNANIQDQFEFVQHQWLNSSRFAGLDGEVDPLVGPRHDGQSSMTLQAPNGSRQVALPTFIDLVGGAYFFLPGFQALVCLTNLP